MLTQNENLDIQVLALELDTRLRGLPHPDIPSVRLVRREFSQRIKNAAPQTVIDLALLLLKDPRFGHRFVAYELVAHHRPALRTLGESALEELGWNLDSWQSVDTFACYLAGPTWREEQVPDEWVRRWARSPNRWQRRAALVCTVALNNRARGGRGDAARTLEICRMLVSDRDDMVVKAMSWALRELVYHDRAAVEAFLQAQENDLAPRVSREVRNKLATGLKNPKKKETGGYRASGGNRASGA